jgi:hypothetical protein
VISAETVVVATSATAPIKMLSFPFIAASM